MPSHGSPGDAQDLQRFGDIFPFVAVRRRPGGACGYPAWTRRTKFIGRCFNRSRMGLLPFLEGLMKADLEIFHQRPVGSVEPDHRLLRSIVMIVPGSPGCGDEVSRFHGERLPVDGRLSSAASNNESDRAHGVPMSLGYFSGLDELSAEHHRMGCR